MHPASLTIELPDEQATEAFARSLASRLEGLSLITLSGDLGAGKTTLVRALLRALGYRGKVKSPTYTLVESYPDCHPPVHHFDLYRLADPDELEYLGFSDYLDGGALLLVEWPERGAGLLPVPDLRLTLSPLGAGRCLAVDACSLAGEAITGVIASFHASN